MREDWTILALVLTLFTLWTIDTVWNKGWIQGPAESSHQRTR